MEEAGSNVFEMETLLEYEDSLYFCVIIPSYLYRFKHVSLIKSFFSPIVRVLRVINTDKVIKSHKVLLLAEIAQLSHLSAEILGSHVFCPFV